jgi:hypothetical protein
MLRRGLLVPKTAPAVTRGIVKKSASKKPASVETVAAKVETPIVTNASTEVSA